MNDNYLWDRTGKPDPEIQELEALLGTLRYQPRPLEIPANLTVGRRRSFYVPATIAAAIIMAALLLGLWFQFGRRPTVAPVQAKQDDPIQPAPGSEIKPTPEPKSTIVKNESPETKPQRQLNRNVLAVYRRPALRRETVEPQLTEQEQADKEQVLLALRLVSAKLNLAQRKTMSAPAQSPIRNQHKIG